MSVTVRDIITQWLQSHGCEGLCDRETGGGCVCGLDELGVACEYTFACVPAKRLEPDDVLIPATIPAEVAVDWDKLFLELYSVLAHASAGTDFTNPDLQMAVDGCIVEVKRAMAIPEESGEKCKACGYYDRGCCTIGAGNHCIHRAEDYFEERK